MTQTSALFTLVGMYVVFPLAVVAGLVLIQKLAFRVHVRRDDIHFTRFGQPAGIVMFKDAERMRRLPKGRNYFFNKRFGLVMWLGGVEVYLRDRISPRDQLFVVAASNWREILAAWEAWQDARRPPSG